jgi:phenylacetic acid degradation operon negative regulatory protein
MIQKPTSPIQELLDIFRQTNRVKAGSLIISVFGDSILPRGGKIWLGSLIKLLAPLQLNERLIRTTVFRLAKDEWLSNQSEGRRTNYQLTHSGWKRFEDASRQIYAPGAPSWDKRWRLVMVTAELTPSVRDKLKNVFYWQGFGQMNANCFIHPSADLKASLDAISVRGMSDFVSQCMPLIAVNPLLDSSANDSAIVRLAWNLDELRDSYLSFVKTYKKILEEIKKNKREKIDDETAFLIRTLLIHDFRRLLLRDPELPHVLLPKKWPGEAARDLTKEIYQRLLEPSERHLNQHVLLANGKAPQASNILARRFK